jgi:hypothetical protein
MKPQVQHALEAILRVICELVPSKDLLQVSVVPAIDWIPVQRL